jgi:hypothetical protein
LGYRTILRAVRLGGVLTIALGNSCSKASAKIKTGVSGSRTVIRQRQLPPEAASYEGQQSADSVEKFGFSDRLNLGTTATG